MEKAVGFGAPQEDDSEELKTLKATYKNLSHASFARMFLDFLVENERTPGAAADAVWGIHGLRLAQQSVVKAAIVLLRARNPLTALLGCIPLRPNLIGQTASRSLGGISR